VAKALAVRVRFPAWSASVRSRHLSIVICRSSDIRCARLRTASTKFVRKRGLRGQSRSSTAIEHPKRFGRRGFDSHRARQFRRAVEFGLSVKRETASAFKPRTIGQLMDSHLASCPSFLFGMGRCALVIELGSSNCDRAARENEKMRVRFPSRNIEAASCPSFSIFDGSQDWVIVHHDVVAGSSPASGTKCRSSSVGRARKLPVRSLSVGSFSGP
jgi:hypothetical protein